MILSLLEHVRQPSPQCRWICPLRSACSAPMSARGDRIGGRRRMSLYRIRRGWNRGASRTQNRTKKEKGAPKATHAHTTHDRIRFHGRTNRPSVSHLGIPQKREKVERRREEKRQQPRRESGRGRGGGLIFRTSMQARNRAMAAGKARNHFFYQQPTPLSASGARGREPRVGHG